MRHKVYCRHPPLAKGRELPIVFDVPLKDEDWNSWLDFKVLGERTPAPFGGLNVEIAAKFKRTIALDHPFAIVICEFAVAAFNRACEMEVKWGVANNMHDIEFMECQYLRFNKNYQFYVTLEAIEEGHLGVYEAKVLCNCDDGKRTLIKFLLTSRTPAGKKAMAISRLSHLRSVYGSVKGLKEDIDICLEMAHKSKKGKRCRALAMYQFIKGTRMSQACGRKKDMVVDELICLKKHYRKAMEGLRKELYQDTRSLFPPACNQRTNPDDWIAAEKDFYSGMRRRKWGTAGYNYYTPLGDYQYSLWF